MWSDLPKDVCLKAEYKEMLTNAVAEVRLECTQTKASTHTRTQTHTHTDAHTERYTLKKNPKKTKKHTHTFMHVQSHWEIALCGSANLIEILQIQGT